MTGVLAVAPRAAMERKPRHGAECNRCGVCCIAILCPLAMHVFERTALPGPCPALVWDGPNSSCGLANNPLIPTKYQEAARLLIRAGTGCDARFNGEPADDSAYARWDQWDNDHATALRAARNLWGSK
jgi:hypothetical protein